MIYKMNCSPWMGPSCFHKSAEDTWMRSSWECLFALHLLRTDTCSQGCIASIARPFAVRVPPHYAAVTHGRVTHSRLTRDAGVTAFTLSSVITRRSWLPRRSCPAVPRGARRAWWEKQMRNGTQCDRGDIEYHRPVGITRLSTSKLRDLTHLDAQVAPALQSSTDQGSRSRPSSQALLQKRSLRWSVGAIKLC